MAKYGRTSRAPSVKGQGRVQKSLNTRKAGPKKGMTYTKPAAVKNQAAAGGVSKRRVSKAGASVGRGLSAGTRLENRRAAAKAGSGRKVPAAPKAATKKLPAARAPGGYKTGGTKLASRGKGSWGKRK